jgi:pimeloyl-ACP methyl ester carboxylesterase
MVDRRFNVLLLPGVVLPAQLAYGSLLAALGDNVQAVAKDLELYAEAVPPQGYELDIEMDGILREADDAGFDRFHLAGYSGGGAAALMFAARHGHRLLSLALLEPAWAGNDRSPPEEALQEQFRALDGLPADEQMGEFTRLQLAPGVEPPPRAEGPPPPWLAKRPAGIRALLRAFDAGTLDLDALRRFTQPVYFALGGLSNPNYFAQMAERLSDVFPDFTVETFPKRHHFDPPHRSEPEHTAASLLALWQRAAR